MVCQASEADCRVRGEARLGARHRERGRLVFAGEFVIGTAEERACVPFWVGQAGEPRAMRQEEGGVHAYGRAVTQEVDTLQTRVWRRSSFIRGSTADPHRPGAEPRMRLFKRIMPPTAPTTPLHTAMA